jgi:hypothetical protein
MMDSPTTAPLLEAIERATRDFKLCPNRIWEVGSRLEGWESNLPGVLPQSYEGFEEALKHQDHSACTFDFCENSSRNFTAVEQRHELESCDGDTCFCLRGLFRDDELVKRLKSKQWFTAWTLDGLSMVMYHQPFIAISHVWSDGTETGAWSPGEVNECLYSFFRRIAEQFQCEGIGWDAICIPRDPEARSQALNII